MCTRGTRLTYRASVRTSLVLLMRHSPPLRTRRGRFRSSTGKFGKRCFADFLTALCFKLRGMASLSSRATTSAATLEDGANVRVTHNKPTHAADGAFCSIRNSLSCVPGETYERSAFLRMASDSAAADGRAVNCRTI